MHVLRFSDIYGQVVPYFYSGTFSASVLTPTHLSNKSSGLE